MYRAFPAPSKLCQETALAAMLTCHLALGALELRKSFEDGVRTYSFLISYVFDSNHESVEVFFFGQIGNFGDNTHKTCVSDRVLFHNSHNLNHDKTPKNMSPKAPWLRLNQAALFPSNPWSGWTEFQETKVVGC